MFNLHWSLETINFLSPLCCLKQFLEAVAERPEEAPTRGAEKTVHDFDVESRV